MALHFDHMAPLIQVYDMPEAIAFYRDLLGFEIIEHSPEIDSPQGRYFHWAWLRHGDTHLMFNTAYDEGERPPERDPVRQAMHEDTGFYFSCPDPDAAYVHLRDAGVGIEPPRDAAYGMRQLWLRDPDGYSLCFQTAA